VTDLRDQLAGLIDNEPEAPYDIDTIVRSGRRARRRHNAALAAAGTVGAAGLTAAVVIPVMAAGGGHQPSVSLGVRPTVTTTASHGKCYVMAAPKAPLKHELAKLVRSGRVGKNPAVVRLKPMKNDHRVLLEVCTKGTAPVDPRAEQPQTSQAPAGPPYDYTETPEAISSRLGAHLQDRVSGFGLTISYTRPFAQATSKLDNGRPSYYDGNVDVHESTGYADIGVQVTHAVTELVQFTGDCTAAEHCTETKLPDGSILQTEQVAAGKNDVILTAEVHRPDGVVVHAQESNYPFGPDAGSQPHGDQPLTLDQLVALAEDEAFTF